MWSAMLYEDENNIPCCRSKHSVTFLDNNLYLLAGRNGNVALKDFWRYDLINKKWYLLKSAGDCPPCLQEHTAIAYHENIYVFGGELGFSSGVETPLWIYESKINLWRKMKGRKGATVPKGRRGHTSLIHRDSTLMYGGYCDLKGSSNELWVFHFETESWHLIVNSKNDPIGRHKHTAVLHGEDMWVYGGMTDLEERSDLWKFNTSTKKWCTIKCKVSPGPLHSHVACALQNSMMIFGGEKNGEQVNELWKFDFGMKTWQNIKMSGISPQPVSESSAVLIPDSTFPERNKKNGNSFTETLYAHYCAEPNASRSDESLSPSFENGTPLRPTTALNNGSLSSLKQISKLSQMNISRMAQADRHTYEALYSKERLTQFVETTNDDLNQFALNSVCQMKLKNRPQDISTPLTPSQISKLVFLKHEDAVLIEDSSYIPENLYFSDNLNGLNYVPDNSNRSSDPLIISDLTSPENTLDNASYENIYKLFSPNGKLNEKDMAISFTNPNYLFTDHSYKRLGTDEDEFVTGDFVKLINSLECGSEKVSSPYEMKNLEPEPPKTLPLNYDNEMNQFKTRIKSRVNSTNNYESLQSRSFCIFLVGGKTNRSVTIFRKPISMWKLLLTEDYYI